MDSVVITGVGIFVPGYTSTAVLFEDLAKGQSLLRRYGLDGDEDLPVIASPALTDQLDVIDRHFSIPELARSSVLSRMAAYAAKQSLRSAAIAPASLGERCSLFIGCNKSLPNLSVFTNDPRRTDDAKQIILNIDQCQAAHWVKKVCRIGGPVMTMGDACISGASAMVSARRRLLAGEIDVAICGATEQATHPIMQLSFARLGALSDELPNNPQQVCRPFDKHRSGCVLADAAAFLVLERLSDARRRGAKILARLSGTSRQSEAYKITTTQPDGAEYARCIRAALEDAEVKPASIQHISAHGTSTPNNDVSEAAAIHEVFFDNGQALCSSLSVTATKSALGHALGASSALEAILSVETLSRQQVLPTLNYREPGEGECVLPIVTASRSQRIDHVLSHSFGFGGENACLVLSRYQG